MQVACIQQKNINIEAMVINELIMASYTWALSKKDMKINLYKSMNIQSQLAEVNLMAFTTTTTCCSLIQDYITM